MGNSKVLTTTEVAKRLRVSRGTVSQLLNSKQLKGFRIRTHWRVYASDLDEFIQNNTVGG